MSGLILLSRNEISIQYAVFQMMERCVLLTFGRSIVRKITVLTSYVTSYSLLTDLL